jgi:hypothetical protein
LIQEEKYGYFVSSCGGVRSARVGSDSARDASSWIWLRKPCSNMRWSTRSRRARAAFGWAIGSKPVGEATMPASSAASCGSSWAAQLRVLPRSAQPVWSLPKYVRAADSIP